MKPTCLIDGSMDKSIESLKERKIKKEKYIKRSKQINEYIYIQRERERKKIHIQING